MRKAGFLLKGYSVKRKPEALQKEQGGEPNQSKSNTTRGTWSCIFSLLASLKVFTRKGTKKEGRGRSGGIYN